MARKLSISEDITCLQTLEAHTSDVTSVDFGNNALLATGSGDKTARLWRWSPREGVYEEDGRSPLQGHKYAVTCVCFSPQGTLLATASVDGTAILWNVATGARIHTFVQTTGGAVRCARFSADCSALVTAGDDGVLCVWDLLRRSLARWVSGHEGAVHALATSPDGRLLFSGCSLGSLRAWPLLAAAAAAADGPGPGPEPEQAAPLAQAEAHDLGILAGDCSPLQLLVDAGAEDAEACETDPDAAERSGDWCRPTTGAGGRRLAHRYLLATGGNDHAVRLWHALSPACSGGCGPEQLRAVLRPARPAHALAGHGSAVTSVRFGPRHPLLASAALDRTARLWQADTGACLAVVAGHSRILLSAAVSRCGSLLATASNDRSARVWAAAGDRRPPPPPPRPAFAARYRCGHPDGDDPGEGAVLRRAEAPAAAPPALLQRLSAGEGAVNGVAFGPEGTVLAAATGDKMVRVWARSDEDTDAGDPGRFSEANCSPLEAHRYSVLALEFGPGPAPLLASCSLDGEAVLWDVEKGERAGAALQCSGGGGLRALRFSPDGHLLVTAGDDERVCVWALASGELLLSAEGHSDAVSALAVSPDSQLVASCSADESIRVWGVSPPQPGCLLALEAAHDLGAGALDFSPVEGLPGRRGRQGELADRDQSYLLASGGNDSAVRLWRLPARLSGDPPRLALGGARPGRVLAGHSGSVSCVRFAPGSGGQLLASAAIDRAARLWNVYSGECLHVLEGHDSLLTSVTFSPDCSLLATGSLDKTVLLWELPPQLVLQSAGPDRLRAQTKKDFVASLLAQVVEWRPADVARWLQEWGLPRLAERAQTARLRGPALLKAPLGAVLSALGLGADGSASSSEEEGGGGGGGCGGGPEERRAELRARLAQLVRWLRRAEAAGGAAAARLEQEPPHEFLCPITHELMRDPVLCSDGFTYERAALSEWLLGGRFSSPMTNAPLSSTRLRPHTLLRRQILEWLYGDADADADADSDDTWPDLAEPPPSPAPTAAAEDADS